MGNVWGTLGQLCPHGGLSLAAHALAARRARATAATAASAASALASASAKSTRPAEQRRSRTNMIGATSAVGRLIFAEPRRAWLAAKACSRTSSQ
eukprot:scaffold86769_cov50-Phaeocystis_antarctica.AAC.1